MKRNEVVIRKARDTDLEEVLKVLNKAFRNQQKAKSGDRDIALWKWKHHDGAFGKSIVHLAECGGKVIGCGALWPFKFHYRDTLLQALQPCDTAVSAEARGKGVFTKINQARISYATEHGYDFLFNFPNHNSLPGYLKMGWQTMGQLRWQVKALQPLQVVKGFGRTLQSGKLEVHKEYWIEQEASRGLRPFHCAADKICIQVSHDLHQWRYINHPNRTYGIIKATDEAFAVFTLAENDYYKEMIVIEMRYSNPDEYKKLLSCLKKSAKNLKAGILVYAERNQSKMDSIPLSRGFLPKKSKNFVIYPINTNLKEDLMQPANWDFQLLLHDSI